MKKNAYKVLLVDDYEINLELLEAYLSKSDDDFTVFKAMNGTQAWQIITNTDLDMVLLDVMLPDILGVELCKKIKALDQTLPVIMLTALSDRSSRVLGLQSGADEFLTKPVDGYELVIRMRNLLKLHKVTNDLNLRYQQLQRELAVASALQKSFLPTKLPQIADLAIEVVYQPSSYIGGDFYDFLPIDQEKIGFFISDVKGSGVASAMITATLKDNINKLFSLWAEPALFLQELNKQLTYFFANISNDFFVTAFYGVLDWSTKRFVYTNAGQNSPYLLSEKILKLDSAEGYPLGIFSDSVYPNHAVSFPQGAEIFMYTDGIFELPLFGKNFHDAVLLEDIFAQIGRQLSPLQLETLKTEIKNVLATETIADDVNYIAIKNIAVKEEKR